MGIETESTFTGLLNNTPTFEKELTALINKYSKDYDSHTPDMILSTYILNCLNIFSIAVKDRDNWYGEAQKSVFTCTSGTNLANNG